MECHLDPREAPKEHQFYRMSSSKPLQTSGKQCMKTRASGERELVKYMSKLPGFLERTETPQEKLLNVGVLNWGRLEKWQHGHKRMSEKSSLPSVPQRHDSAAPPTDESSARSRKVQSHSPGHQRTQHNSLQFHLMSTLSEEGSQTTRSYDECVKECRDSKTMWKNNFTDHRCFSIPNDQFCQDTAALGTDRCVKKDLKVKICPKNETLSNSKLEVGLNTEVKSKTDGDRRGENENKLKEINQNDQEGEAGRKQQGASELYHSTKKPALKEARTRRRRSTERPKEVCHVEVDYSTQHSCPLQCEADSFIHTQVKGTIGFAYADKTKVLGEISESVRLSAKATASSTRGKSTEDKRLASLSVKHSADEPAQGQDSKSCEATSEKGRNISPFQRLGFSTGKLNKNSNERDSVPVTRVDSIVNSTKSGSQNAATSSGVDNSDSRKPSGQDRATTSPFRRLLEPLLKPKATHSGNFLDDPRAQGVQRVKLGMAGCKTVNVNDSAHERRLGSSMVQALLKITVKNDQPLFTFAMNKERDVLAATLKKLGSPEEDECTGIYTFFSIQEHKKNGGWTNQRGKGQTHGIITNVVAQMRASSSSPSGFIREFILFSVELGQPSEEKSDLQLKNELAAIVIKMPRRLNSSAQNRGVHNDGGENCLEDHFENRSSPVICDQDISATVILQSGVHSLPHKGGPSSLIQRWRSGGSCDCGGWDMGCNLRVLSNRPSKNSTSSNSLPCSDRLELFFLGGQPDEQPFLSFTPFKEGMYTVGYNSSLSLLQAFSICIAVAESRKLSENLEHRSSYNEHKVQVPDRETKPNGSTGEEVSARYVAYPPPLSPVGRV